MLRLHPAAQADRIAGGAHVSRLPGAVALGLPRHPQQQPLPAGGGVALRAGERPRGAVQPAQGRRCAHGDRVRRLAGDRGTAAHQLRARHLAGLPHRCAGEPCATDDSSRPGRAARPEVPRISWPPHPPGSQVGEPVRRAAHARHPAAPPVRLLRHGGGVHRVGGQGPRRRQHEADALPHQRRLAAVQGADRGRAVQGGDGGHRVDGALRRGLQHPLGARDGGRRSGRLPRHPGAEDALQAGPDGSPRPGRRHPALRATGYGKLQLGDRAPLYRHQPADGAAGDHLRRAFRLSLPDGRIRCRELRAAAGGAADAGARHSATDCARDGACEGWPSRRHCCQDERAARPRNHRGAV